MRSLWRTAWNKLGIDPKSLSLKVGLFGGEPWSEKMRAEIESRLLLSATDNYGLSEVIGPGVAGECSCKKGLHIYEDAFIPEIIDPETGAVLPSGSEGELVLTTLTKEAFPMIRYRTGDITSLDYAPCECGRTLVRMKKISGVPTICSLSEVSMFFRRKLRMRFSVSRRVKHPIRLSWKEKARWTAWS